MSILHLGLVVPASWGSPPAWVYLLVLMLLGAGVLLFIRGFREYREYRILEDTPRFPVRSIPMGLVHVYGKAEGDNRLTSPLTHLPCFYYILKIEKWVKKDKGEGWETYRTDTDEQEFYLEDGTGKVRVNLHGAEYDVTKTFEGGVGPRALGANYVDPSLGVPGPTKQDLNAYLQQSSPTEILAELTTALHVPGASALGKAVEIGQKLESLGISLGGGGLSFELGGPSYLFTEHCLRAEHDCNILGTCVENPQPQGEHDQNLIQKGQNEPTFVVSDKTEKGLEKDIFRKALVTILGGAALIVAVVAGVLAVFHAF